MTDRRLRWLGLAPLGSFSVGCLALASAINPIPANADDATLIMGGTGNPDPDDAYLTASTTPTFAEYRSRERHPDRFGHSRAGLPADRLDS